MLLLALRRDAIRIETNYQGVKAGSKITIGANVGRISSAGLMGPQVIHTRTLGKGWRMVVWRTITRGNLGESHQVSIVARTSRFADA